MTVEMTTFQADSFERGVARVRYGVWAGDHGARLRLRGPSQRQVDDRSASQTMVLNRRRERKNRGRDQRHPDCHAFSSQRNGSQRLQHVVFCRIPTPRSFGSMALNGPSPASGCMPTPTDAAGCCPLTLTLSRKGREKWEAADPIGSGLRLRGSMGDNGI